MKKAVGIVAVLVALGAGFYLFSTYIVSKLDGTGGVTAPQSDMTAFESAHIGLRFQYPNTYVASTTHTGNAEREWHVVTLLPEGYVPPQGGEGPPAIVVQDIPNPEGLSLEVWIKSDARSNWKLAPDNATLTPVTVGGESGLKYQHGGLYMSDAVAVSHNGKIYLFEGAWQDANDRIRVDFAKLIETVQFI